jgi:hypothetical protein
MIFIFILTGLLLMWILFKPLKTERRRFSLRERRLQRDDEKEQADENEKGPVQKMN